MTAKSITEEVQAETVVDDLPKEEVKVDQDKLAALKAKSQAKQQESKMSARIIDKKSRSLALGIVGTGQCGSRIAAQWFALGYETIVLNTAAQDLKFIQIPDSNKLLLSKHSPISGAAREMSIGHEAASAHRAEILELVNEKLSNAQVYVLCSSLGGGSGAGSLDVVIDVLSSTGKPIIILCALPSTNEDVKIKLNSLETLSKLTKLAQNKVISNLIIADNTKIESVLASVSQLNFFDEANKSIVEVLDTFNTLSSMPSPMKPLDSAEFAKLLVDPAAISIYGKLTIKDNLEDETKIAESIITDLKNNLLAEGFELKQSKMVGFIVTSSAKTWEKLSSSAISYASAMIGDFCDNPQIFKGLYVVNDVPDGTVNVYSYFTGLGLPTARIEELRRESKELQTKTKTKDDARNLTLELDTGVSETTSKAAKIKEQIAAKASSFHKLMGGTTDRRK